VNLTRAGIEDIRTVATNDDGTYTFERLPAGSYTLSVSKGGYISISYGAAKPGMPGSPITLVDNQQVSANPVPLMRGAVIAGRVTDPTGRPVALASVRADQVITIGNERRRRTTSGATASGSTNEHGEYRLYPLLAGEYAVSAVSPPIFMQSEITSAELAAATQGLPAEPKPRKLVTPVPTMFPGTADAGGGIPVVVSRGQERLGVDFAIQYLAAARVTGTVTGVDGRPAQGAQVFCQLKDINTLLQPTGLPLSTANAVGGFTCPGLPPAQYVLAARFVPPSQAGTAPSPPVWGFTEVAVAGQDVSGLSIRLQAGFT
jgi:protocatechuate 3,4-dioxygenase beta subunit